LDLGLAQRAVGCVHGSQRFLALNFRRGLAKRRHRARSEAIQNSAVPWIASLRSQ
jgi:hypothetical protein